MLGRGTRRRTRRAVKTTAMTNNATQIACFRTLPHSPRVADTEPCTAEMTSSATQPTMVASSTALDPRRDSRTVKE